MHKDIKSFSEGDQVEGYYAVREAALHMTASGKPYIRLTLSDATGNITGNMWDGDNELFKTFKSGDIIKIRAIVETYRGAPQIKVLKLRATTEDEVDYSDFIPTTPADINELKTELKSIIDSITDADYRAIIESFFNDAEIYEKFCRAPAAKGNHHAYLGGLLEHTVALCRYAVAFSASSPAKIDQSLLIAGTLLHDIGKIDELSVGAVIEYTDRGKLLGHLIIGSMMVEENAGILPDFPEEKKLLLQHMILSHHGKFEYGSPVLPAIPEALALHHIDNLDAKTIAASRLIEDDETENHWTPRSWMLETQLYKPRHASTETKDTSKDSNDNPGTLF